MLVLYTHVSDAKSARFWSVFVIIFVFAIVSMTLSDMVNCVFSCCAFFLDFLSLATDVTIAFSDSVDFHRYRFPSNFHSVVNEYL